MERRDFIKAMIAAGAVPAFLAEHIPGDLELAKAGDLQRCILNPESHDTLVTGFRWLTTDGHCGRHLFHPGGEIKLGEACLEARVKVSELSVTDIDLGELSVIDIYLGDRLMIQEATRGRVELVYFDWREAGVSYTTDPYRAVVSAWDTQGMGLTLDGPQIEFEEVGDDAEELHDADLYDNWY